MANINAPFGFRPVEHLNGSTWNGQTNLYHIPSTDVIAYYIGDPVKTIANADANGVPDIQKAAGTDTVRGVIVGILPVYPGVSMVGAALTLERVSTPSTGKPNDFYVLVADAPDVVYEVQGDSGVWVAADMNKNTIFTVAVPSPAANPLSASVATHASVNTTNTLNVKLRGLVRDPLNVYGAYARLLVTFNLHELNAAGTTAY